MDEKKFLKEYISPSDSNFNSEYQIELPAIEGLIKSGDFIVQGQLEKTTSTNIISKYISEKLGVNLIEVYKRTEHDETGTFVRLVGSMSIVKQGYPFLFLDAAATNVNIRSGEKENLKTRIAVHFPQSEKNQSGILFESLCAKADEAGIPYKKMSVPTMPDFWGDVWIGELDGLELGALKTLRDNVWESYKAIIETTDSKENFDYKLVQDQMIHKTAESEHKTFAKMGMTVPREAQSGFFSIFTSSP